MLRTAILAGSRNGATRRLVAGAPVSRSVVRRFVAGEQVDDALRVSGQLRDRGLRISLDRLGEDTSDAAQAAATADAYVELLQRLAAAGLTPGAEVSLKLSAVGAALDEDLATTNARWICAAAEAAGTTVTLDMEDSSTTDATLRILANLRAHYPSTGAVLQAYLRRTEDDCRVLAAIDGQRVRLCKGAYAEPETVAFQRPEEVDRSYVRCLRILAEGRGYPMVATHDPRLIAIAAGILPAAGRSAAEYEFQLLYGVRPREQARLAAAGHVVRVYVPYGTEWYGYLMRRLAERPANLMFFLRALATSG